MATLWDDVPPALRSSFPYDRWMGERQGWTPDRACAYAVPAGWTGAHAPVPGEMRQCRSIARPGTTACPTHDQRHSSPSAGEGILRNIIRRAAHAAEPADQLRWFRSLTDGEIDAIRMVGTKTARAIREARDTWDDERVMAFFGFEPAPALPQTEAFWAARPDVFNVVGG